MCRKAKMEIYQRNVKKSNTWHKMVKISCELSVFETLYGKNSKKTKKILCRKKVSKIVQYTQKYGKNFLVKAIGKV